MAFHVSSWLQHLKAESAPVTVHRRAAAPSWEDAALHREAFEADSEIYALCGVAAGAVPAQQERVLFQLLAGSRRYLGPDARSTLDRVVTVLLAMLPADRVVTVFLALRRARANHKHTTRAIVRFLLEHPRAPDLIAKRGSTLVDCLEHALGRDVARACVRRVRATGDDRYLEQNLLRHGRDPERVRRAFTALHGASPVLAECAPYEDYHVAFQRGIPESAPRPTTVTATSRGDISATLVHLYRGGHTDALAGAVDDYVRRRAAQLPEIDLPIAIVLDASASTQGYGEREFCCIAQSVALCRTLQACCQNSRLRVVGGAGDPPRPGGITDLATAVLDALDGDPALVAVVSDGYENRYPGDLEAVIRVLPRAGVDTPVVFLNSKFTHKDNLELRSPVESGPVFEFWHEEDFQVLVPDLFLLAFGRSRARLGAYLKTRLEQLEKENDPWLTLA